MGKDKDEEFEKEYAKLKLQYAFENDEIRELVMNFAKEVGENFESKEPKSRMEWRKRNKAKLALMEKVTEFGISYDYMTKIKSQQANIDDEIFNLGMYSEAYLMPSVYFIAKGRLFNFRSSKDNSKLTEILKKRSFENNEEWFMERYKDIKIKGGIESYVSKQEFDTFACSTFNKKTEKFYQIFNDRLFEEYGILKNKKYLNLNIDMTKKTEDIIRELKPIINYFKNTIDTLNQKVRRQDIDLYKRYLKVYKLVQEKGEKWTEIAKEVFPDATDLESARVTVYEDYNRAKRLIKEGLP